MLENQIELEDNKKTKLEKANSVQKEYKKSLKEYFSLHKNIIWISCLMTFIICVAFGIIMTSLSGFFDLEASVKSAILDKIKVGIFTTITVALAAVGVTRFIVKNNLKKDFDSE